MDILKTTWHYVTTYWPVITMIVSFFLTFFAGLYFGIKVGHKWGKEGAEQWLRLKFRNFVEFRLGQPLVFLNEAYGKGNENGVCVPGTLELDLAGPEDADMGLVFKFNFIPDKDKQQKTGPC